MLRWVKVVNVQKGIHFWLFDASNNVWCLLLGCGKNGDLFKSSYRYSASNVFNVFHFFGLLWFWFQIEKCRSRMSKYSVIFLMNCRISIYMYICMHKKQTYSHILLLKVISANAYSRVSITGSIQTFKCMRLANVSVQYNPCYDDAKPTLDTPDIDNTDEMWVSVVDAFFSEKCSLFT